MYIISLTHTRKHENFITLWRPDNKGYCYSQDNAGYYPHPEVGYHDNEDNMPLPIVLATDLFEDTLYDGGIKKMIPNTPKTWKKLGVKMTRRGLVRL